MANKAEWCVKEIKSAHLKMALEVIEKKMTIKSPATGSPPNKKQKIFALDGSSPSSRFFFFKMKIKNVRIQG